MAKVSATAIEIRANTDRAIAEIKKLDAAVRKQGEAMKKASVGADKASASMNRFQRSMARAARGGGAFAASMQFLVLGTGVHAFRNMTRAALEYDAALVQVTKTTGLQGVALDNMREKINQISEITGVARSEIAMLVSYAGQLGVSGSTDLAEFAKWVTIIADATDVTGEQAAKTIARLLKITDTPIMTGIKSVSDVIIELGNNLSATEAEIVSIVEGAGVEMALFGFTPEEILAYSGALASLKGDAASTATMINKLATNLMVLHKEGGEGLRLFAEVAGVEFKNIQKLMEEDFAGTLAKFLHNWTTTLDAGARKQVSAQYGLPDLRSTKAMPKLGKNLPEALDLMAGAAGAAMEEFGARVESTSHQYTTATNRMAIAFDDLSRVITETLLPTYKMYAQGLEDFLKLLMPDYTEEFQENFKSGRSTQFRNEIQKELADLVDPITGKKAGAPGKDLTPAEMKAVNKLYDLGDRMLVNDRKMAEVEKLLLTTEASKTLHIDPASGTIEERVTGTELSDLVKAQGMLRTRATELATEFEELAQYTEAEIEAEKKRKAEREKKGSEDLVNLPKEGEGKPLTQSQIDKLLKEKMEKEIERNRRANQAAFGGANPNFGGFQRNRTERTFDLETSNQFGGVQMAGRQASEYQRAVLAEERAEAAAQKAHEDELERLAEEERQLLKYHQEQMDRISQFYGTWESAIDDISRSVGIAFTGMNKDINGLGDVWDIVLDRMNNALMESFVIDPIDEAVNSMLKSGLEWLGVPTPESVADKQRIEHAQWTKDPYSFPGAANHAGGGGGFLGNLIPGSFSGGFGTMVDSWIGGGGANQFGHIGSGFGGGGIIESGLSWLGGLIGLSEGGDIRKEGVAMVGEHGPELLYLPQSARVQPLGPGRNGAGGGNSFTFNIDADDPIRVRRVVEGMIPEISKAANNSLVSKNSRGGNTTISKAF